MNFVRSGESIIPAYLSLCVDDGVYSYVKTRRRLHESYMAGCNDRGCSIKKSLENNPSAGRGGREGEREKDRRDTSRARRGSDSNSTHN